jgi:methyl-accepting chemotaxis protein
MLLSLMCADECSVLWPYLLESGDTDGIDAPENLVTIRAEFAAVVEERRRRELCRPVLVADVRGLQRETSNQIAEQSNRISVLNNIVSGQASRNAEQTIQIAEQTNQISEQTNQIAEQSNQIADLQRSTGMIVEQNQQMQEQMRQMHALLMSREEEQSSADVDERDKRAVKRRRTGR